MTLCMRLFVTRTRTKTAISERSVWRLYNVTSGLTHCRWIFCLSTLRNKKAVLSQREPHDAAVNFDRYIVINRTRKVGVGKRKTQRYIEVFAAQSGMLLILGLEI